MELTGHARHALVICINSADRNQSSCQVKMAAGNLYNWLLKKSPDPVNPYGLPVPSNEAEHSANVAVQQVMEKEGNTSLINHRRGSNSLGSHFVDTFVKICDLCR